MLGTGRFFAPVVPACDRSNRTARSIRHSLHGCLPRIHAFTLTYL
jgi:hypothetical protein